MTRTPFVASLLVVSLAAATVHAQPSTRPNTDFSSPKAAARAFVAAVAVGDGEAAKAAIVPHDQHAPIVEALANMNAVQKRLGNAAVKAFGESGSVLGGGMDGPDLLKLIDTAIVKETGDTATLAFPAESQQDAYTLHKIEGQWKVDLAALPSGALLESSLPMYQAMADLMTAMITEIEAGKYKNVEEVKQALSMRVLSKMPQAPTTQPSTAPVNQALEPTTKPG